MVLFLCNKNDNGPNPLPPMGLRGIFAAAGSNTTRRQVLTPLCLRAPVCLWHSPFLLSPPWNRSLSRANRRSADLGRMLNRDERIRNPPTAAVNRLLTSPATRSALERAKADMAAVASKVRCRADSFRQPISRTGLPGAVTFDVL